MFCEKCGIQLFKEHGSDNFEPCPCRLFIFDFDGRKRGIPAHSLLEAVSKFGKKDDALNDGIPIIDRGNGGIKCKVLDVKTGKTKKIKIWGKNTIEYHFKET